MTRPIYDLASDIGYQRSWKFDPACGWLEWFEDKGRWIKGPKPSKRATYTQSKHSIEFYGFVAP